MYIYHLSEEGPWEGISGFILTALMTKSENVSMQQHIPLCLGYVCLLRKSTTLRLFPHRGELGLSCLISIMNTQGCLGKPLVQ